MKQTHMTKTEWEVLSTAVERLGFRLSRGICQGADMECPTLCIDRPDCPEWPGVWSTWEAEPGEAAVVLEVFAAAVFAWNERETQ